MRTTSAGIIEPPDQNMCVEQCCHCPRLSQCPSGTAGPTISPTTVTVPFSSNCGYSAWARLGWPTHVISDTHSNTVRRRKYAPSTPRNFLSNRFVARLSRLAGRNAARPSRSVMRLSHFASRSVMRLSHFASRFATRRFHCGEAKSPHRTFQRWRLRSIGQGRSRYGFRWRASPLQIPGSWALVSFRYRSPRHRIYSSAHSKGRTSNPGRQVQDLVSTAGPTKVSGSVAVSTISNMLPSSFTV